MNSPTESENPYSRSSNATFRLTHNVLEPGTVVRLLRKRAPYSNHLERASIQSVFLLHADDNLDTSGQPDST